MEKLILYFNRDLHGILIRSADFAIETVRRSHIYQNVMIICYKSYNIVFLEISDGSQRQTHGNQICALKSIGDVIRKVAETRVFQLHKIAHSLSQILLYANNDESR